MDDLRNTLKEEQEINIKGIFKAKSATEAMKITFKHGKKRGETTRFRAIDPHFTWKKGFVNCWTGYPNHGKSELFLQLALAKSMHDNWKWVVFCPENMSVDQNGQLSADELFDTLIHAYIGKTTDPARESQMSLEEYERGIDFIDEHFTVVYPIEIPTPGLVLKYFQHVLNIEKIDGCLIDPWNKLIHNYSGLLDEYLAARFAEVKYFAVKNFISFNIVEHPKGGIQKNQDGSLPVPDAFSLRGGAMWNNAMDCILSAYRPKYHIDKADQSVEFHSHKIRNQKLVGVPGMVPLTFDRKTNRYYDELGYTPLNHIVVKEEPRLPYKDFDYDDLPPLPKMPYMDFDDDTPKF